MNESLAIDIIRNAAILFLFIAVYVHIWAIRKKEKTLQLKVFTGIIIGTLTLLLTAPPWNSTSDFNPDIRIVIFSISGLFFGPLTTISAMLISAGHQFATKEPIALVEIVLIFTSGTTGIIWNLIRSSRKQKSSFLEALTFALTVSTITFACTFIDQQAINYEVVKNHFATVYIFHPLLITLIAQFIVRHKKAIENERALMESENRWQFALEGSGDGVWDWDLESGEIFVSKQWMDLFGYHESDIHNITSQWVELVHPEDSERINATIENYLSGKTPFFSTEYRIKCKNGSYKWILASGKIIQRNVEGRPTRFMGTTKDISQRKEYELLLAKERHVLDSIMSSTSESIFFKDLEGRYIRINPATAVNLGIEDTREAIGKTDFDFYDPAFAEKNSNIEQEIIRTGIPARTDDHCKLKDGSNFWRITDRMPLYDEQNNIIGTYGLSKDISEQKLMKEALRESERYTNSILKAIPDLIFIIDSRATFRDFKSGPANDLNLSKRMFINRNVSELFSPKHVIEIKATLRKVLEQRQKERIELELPIEGELETFDYSVFPFDSDRVIAIAHQITQRKKIEKELINSRNQLKKFAAHLQSLMEEERVSQAREIHDELGQILIALKIDMGMLKQGVFKEIKGSAAENVTRQFDKVHSLLNDLINTVRKIMTGLQPELIELAGFTEAARIYIDDFREKHPIKCDFECKESELTLDLPKSIALFRILQEALTNIAKHSGATEVSIHIDCDQSRLKMRIADNGCGFDNSKTESADSYGFTGMFERAYLLDGMLTINGNPGKGAEILFEMPYPTAPTIIPKNQKQPFPSL